MRKHLFIVLSGIVFSLFITYFIVLGDAVDSVSLSTLEMSLAVFIGISSAYLFYCISNILDKLLPWQKHEGNRLLIGIIAHFISTILWCVLTLYLACLLFPKSLNFEILYDAYAIKLGIVFFILMLIFEIIYFALYSYYAYTTLQIETVKQERKQIELQLNALKSQLSPHFLFNSLSTVSSLVFKDVRKAEKFIRKLGEMYHYTLGSYEQKLISLDQELAFVNSYQYLLATRFGPKFQCSIEIPEEVKRTKIPPLTLQMLVENAVKHNVLNEEEPLMIKINYDKKNLIVVNNITSTPNQVSSFKIGLKNINARYLLFCGEGITISRGENFEVKIPIIS